MAQDDNDQDDGNDNGDRNTNEDPYDPPRIALDPTAARDKIARFHK